MILTFIPQWGRGKASYHVAGDVLTINGTTFDLSAVPEGGEGLAQIEPGEDHVFIGPVRRIDGVIHATLICWIGDDAEQDQPDAPWTIDAEGDVEIPYIRKPVIEEPEEPVEPEEVV